MCVVKVCEYSERLWKVCVCGETGGVWRSRQGCICVCVHVETLMCMCVC